MERFEEYKDSETEWIGDIPKDWECFPLWALCRDIDEEVETTDLSIALENVTPWNGKVVIESEDLTQTFDKAFAPNDVLFSKLRPYLAKVVYAECQGDCSSEFLVLRPDASRLYPQYLFWIALSDGFISSVNAATYGTRMPRANWDIVGHMRIPLPSLKMQIEISGFLENLTHEIDSLIEEVEKSIKLLEEYRKSVISETVTKGLDSDASMKDSGIEWIGEIPEHWRISKVKYELINHDSLRKPVEASQRSQSADVLYPYYGASGIVDYIDDYIFDGKRILIGEDGANLVLRNLPLIYVAEGKYWVNNHAHILEPGGNFDFDYIAMQLEMIDLTNYITGSAQPKLSQTNLGMIPVVIPPKEEQTAISKSLESRITVITKIIDARISLLEKLNELRKSIISKAVTGKFKVPGVM